MKKLLLFDLDGTILYTVPDIMACCNDVLSEFSLPPISEEETKAFVGNGAKKLVERMLKDKYDLLEEVYARYSSLFPSYRNRTTYYPGELAFFRQMNALGYSFAVVTNKPQETANAVMNRFFPGWKVFGQTDSFPVKPDPSLTLFAIERMGFSKEDCVFIGDGETDVETAKRAGIPCISVLWGYRSRKTLEEAGATCFASSFEELKTIICNLED
ncbi:MAG: HAD family hydrolase [Clostridia bacterium]|nr:HAD family hydrolase [Clostridia bacterium]